LLQLHPEARRPKDLQRYEILRLASLAQDEGGNNDPPSLK
jgi:hypothetical protein